MIILTAFLAVVSGSVLVMLIVNYVETSHLNKKYQGILDRMPLFTQDECIGPSLGRMCEVCGKHVVELKKKEEK